MGLLIEFLLRFKGFLQITNNFFYQNDITGLEGTTSGPEAVIRKGRGGVLSYVYGDNAKKWLEKTPPPKLRWNAFKSATRSFMEFAKNGNVHGDIALVNLSVDYEPGKKEQSKEILQL